ncbi:MAG: 6-phosphogluconolactonase [Prevotellaceae bacterium]|jgi:glucosamine-6-phosphate deaminase|nr:6-phosphogluconolactonase [Prevotellaceae bacterium]
MKTKYTLPQSGGLKAETIPSDVLQRFEKIPTGIYESEYEGVQYVSNLIAQMVQQHCAANSEKPFVLGLSTGNTPIGLYRELAARHKAGKLDFSRVAVYSLDELYPIKAAEQQSRNFRIHEDFLSHVNIRPENIHLFDGSTPLDKVSDYCKAFESNLLSIDLMIIGMGEQGQIGFNEPGSYAKSRTRLVQLNHSTRKVLLPLFHDYLQVPHMAITMGMNTVMRAQRMVLLAWGENKAAIVRDVVEGNLTEQTPASLLQNHPNAEVVVDRHAAEQLTREQTPWLVGRCEWTRKFMRKAVVWLCGVVKKPILKLTYQDYIENSLGQLLEYAGPYDKINIDIFNDLQHTITGWPGGKPNADDTTRPVASTPFPKRVLIFSPHPDDDVISMGGTFIRLVLQGHDVHVAYQTSGNVAVHDDVVVQLMDAVRELNIGDKYGAIRSMVANKISGEPDPIELREMKAAIRRSEARAAVRSFGMNDSRVHFLNLPFYETGGIQKGMLTQADIDIVVNLLNDVQPHQIYAAGDLSDPHGTHRVCIEAVLEAMQVVRQTQEWAQRVHMWLYRGAWQEWDLGAVDMAVPLSPEEVVKKRHAIYRHLSQKDIVPFPGSDSREFWQRAEDRTQHTAKLYDELGMAEYQAIEVFVQIL